MSRSQSSQDCTHIDDIPHVIFTNIIALITDTRSRNNIALVCRRWRKTERATRTTICLRKNVRHLFSVPSCFSSVTHLDLSHLPPWGHSHLDLTTDPIALAALLRQAFPSVTSLSVYVRTPSTLQLLGRHWPDLRHAKLVRWHNKSRDASESDLMPLLLHCRRLTSLDLSSFYCWTEDIPEALQAYPESAASLTRLDLLITPLSEGFKSGEIQVISAACPNLKQFLVACMFDPRYVDFVDDEALLSVASNCRHLSHLHLADTSALSGVRGNPNDLGFTTEDARITNEKLQQVFAGLPLLEELTLDVGHNVRDSATALETFKSKCMGLKSLKLGQFHGICRAVASHLDGLACCRGLQSLSIKNSADLADPGLIAIAIGCSKLVKFEIQGCPMVSENGLKKFCSVLRRTLRDIKISCCKNLDARGSVRALEPIRDQIEALHIDCVWNGIENEELGKTVPNLSLNGLNPESSCSDEFTNGHRDADCEHLRKKCKTSQVSYFNHDETYRSRNSGSFWIKSWKKLKNLSLWITVGELLSPLPLTGLESCPVLEEIRIKVEGDCRGRPKPSGPAFGLSTLGRYPLLRKLQLHCGEIIGYALTAPSGHMDLSLWDRFYLNGIGSLSLYEIDYWLPQDRDVNQRTLSLPAAGLLSGCSKVRKLFIHGTANEHFMNFLLNIPTLRDVQLREDYYPAPENDMSTEMRIESCNRFEEELNRHHVPD